MENSRDVSVGDLIYGSDAYYGQVTRVGGSVVEFTTVGLMPAGPKGDQGDTGPIGLTGPQGPQGIPGEVQLKDLPHINLSRPDLTGKTEVSDGVYRIYDTQGITIDYEVNTGIFTINGTVLVDVNEEFATNIPANVHTGTLTYISGEGTYTVSSAAWIGDIPAYGSYLYFKDVNLTSPVLTKTYTSLRDFSPVHFWLEAGQVFTNYKFKLQIEVGSRATPYVVSGQVPIYANQEQEEWITPTLLNGWTGDLKYYKDTLGRVWFKGTISNGTSSTIMILPQGYRVIPTQRHMVLVDTNSKISVVVITSAIENYNTPITNINFDGVTFRAEA